MDSKVVHALGRDWLWPAQDDKRCEVVFGWAKDLEIAYKHCKKFDVAIQAGGNMGVWPWLMSKKFKRVYTFEADVRCWPFLVENLRGANNVSAMFKALWHEPSTFQMANDEKEIRNLGAQYVVKGDDVEAETIDNFGFEFDGCDLIYLDIEGAEMNALKGAEKTIARFKPTIIVEDKGLSTRYGYAKGAIERWLAKDFGYEVVARPHRDVVMVCK